MNPAAHTPISSWDLRQVRLLLQGEPVCWRAWADARPAHSAAWCVGAIILGAGLYGAAMGSWRDSWQALYTATKLPLVILLTAIGNGLLNGMLAPLLGLNLGFRAIGNGLLNGMLAPLLGLNLGFRQSLVVVLLSFAVASIILGALSPVALFVVWNAPPLTASTRLSSPEYGALQLTLAVFIAFAGIVANFRLLPLLRQWADRPAIAWRVLLAWLAGNLFLGSQICWVLRPFIWDPAGPVEFIGRQYLRGSFYETVFQAARRLLWP
jgi:hypothetical protein